MGDAEAHPLAMLLGSTAWKFCGLCYLILEKRCPSLSKCEEWRQRYLDGLEQYRKFVLESTTERRISFHRQKEAQYDDGARKLPVQCRFVTSFES